MKKRGLSPKAAGVLTVLAVLLLFLPVLRNGFVDWDDDILIYANPYIRGLDLLHLRWMLTSTLNSAWQPLGWLLYAVIYALAGLRPWAYHGPSLGLHLLSTALVYALGLELLGGVVLASSLSALLFAAHPLQVESVAWASCLADLLCCALTLGAVLSYVKFFKEPRKKSFYRLSLCLSVLAALSRWEVAALPAALIVLDRFVLSNKVQWRSKIPFLFVSMGAGAANAIAKAAVMHYESGPRSPGTGALAALELLGRAAFPAGLRPVYFVTEASRPLGCTALEAVLVLAGISAALFVLRKRIPGAWAAWLIALAAVAPVLSVSRPGPIFMHDRYAYLPLAAFALLSGAALKRWPRAWPAAGALAAALAVVSVQQEAVWVDAETLWKHVIEVDPQESVAYYDLGNLLMARGRPYDAIYYYREQSRRNPEKGRANLAHAWNDLGTAYAELGRWEQAERCFADAAALAPDEPQVKKNLASARARLRK
ncbi:MAG: tetratricopeptide repeat protein [Elusimicrobia bacterium]|nr:tetratricopeptide repeat protein [Elusimicrobiota bacterium]